MEEEQLNSYQTKQDPPKGTALATGAMILGIISTVSLICISPVFIFGGISIILALLSREKNEKLLSQARTGVILSSISLSIAGIILAFGVYTIITDSTFMDEYQKMYDQLYEYENGGEAPDIINGLEDI